MEIGKNTTISEYEEFEAILFKISSLIFACNFIYFEKYITKLIQLSFIERKKAFTRKHFHFNIHTFHLQKHFQSE